MVNDGPHDPAKMESEIEKVTFEQQTWLEDYNVTFHNVYSIKSEFYNSIISYGLMNLENPTDGSELNYFYIVDRLRVDSLEFTPE